ncbi:hypothetical protein CMV_011375 [Castanea mollissima]|uniref:Uncharacterized protein n=1 Tax=Castanea mollissima TaxID=60419 RepID=A0A8J4R5I2_9ROSI|nr:hypothetical protein CMV_011375 [Castanea mollissima]
MHIQNHWPQQNSHIDENGNTPLHIAVYKNQPKAVRRLLLYSGVNIFAKNSEGKTAGDILAQQNQIENREIKLMLQRVGALRAPSLPKGLDWVGSRRRRRRRSQVRRSGTMNQGQACPQTCESSKERTFAAAWRGPLQHGEDSSTVDNLKELFAF